MGQSQVFSEKSSQLCAEWVGRRVTRLQLASHIFRKATAIITILGVDARSRKSDASSDRGGAAFLPFW